MDDADAVHQVFAELAGGNQGRQISVGRRDDSHVNRRPTAVGSDRLDLAAFEETEQEGLHPQTHLTDFVEKDRTFVSLLELSDLVPMCPGEAAPDVPEKLGLEQGFRKRRAVDGDEGSWGSV